MKRILLTGLLFLVSIGTFASHIVGGEFEFVFKRVDLQGNHYYNVSMILYFDKLHGLSGAKDYFANVRIFRKRDNAIIVNGITLSLLDSAVVAYKRPDCASGQSIQTKRFYYSYSTNGSTAAERMFNPNEFNDPEGYYISWERCCRNYAITNIYSENPDFGGRYAGQTFYLEFPPMIKDGVPFFNSAPRLFKPLSDYACPYRLYTVDFQGVDPDGDSLVYSMAIPLNTQSSHALPPGDQLPRPGPYDPVNYRPDFSPSNIMHGEPDLSISKSGKLSVIPTTAGLFVFAVRVEEFRNGEKIGEIRRDFQMLVLTNCPVANPPVIEGKTRSASSYLRNNLTVSFSKDVPDDERCIDIRVSDPDAGSSDQDIELVAVAVNFEDDDLNDDILPPNPTGVLKNGGTISFSVCFPQCPYKNPNFTIDIVALNESCGGALMDTIRLDVTVLIEPNSSPVWEPDAISATVTEGGAPYKVQFTGSDSDNDEMTITPPTFATLFPLYGFSWQTTQNVPGKVVAELNWNTECDLYDFSKKRDFLFAFILDDNDLCDLTPDDTIVFDLERRIPDFHDPVIEYEPNTALKKIELERKIYTTVDFNTLISDEDNDKLEVSAVGVDFDLAEYGANYPNATLTGITSTPTVKPFTWPLNCNQIDLNEKSSFNFYLIVTDKENACNYYLADTLDVTLNVLPPDNLKPELSIDGSTVTITKEIFIGQELTIPIVAADGDTSPKDNLDLTLLSANGDVPPEGFSFTPVSGPSLLTGVWTWKPTCDIYRERKDDKFENFYKFTFQVVDNRCFTELQDQTDTLSFLLRIKDIEIDLDFLPPNVITPNSDDLNDFFAMVQRNEVTGLLENILPIDNCAGRFSNVTIMNRWGRVVYESEDRNFRWYATGENSGVFFYILKYTNREFKGSISVLTDGSSEDNR